MRTPEYGEVGPETARTLDLMEAEYRAKMGLPPMHDHARYDRNMPHGTKTVPANRIIFGTGWIRPPNQTATDRLDLLRRGGFFDPKGGPR